MADIYSGAQCPVSVLDGIVRATPDGICLVNSKGISWFSKRQNHGRLELGIKSGIMGTAICEMKRRTEDL